MVLHTFLGGKLSPNGFRDMVYPMGFIFGLCLLTLIAEPIQTLMLKPGHTIADIRPFVLFLMVIAAIMLAVQFAFPH